MACETMLKPRQSAQQRIAEVARVVARASDALAAGRLKVRVGPQGAIVFDGLTADERDGVSDACIYRRMMVSGSSLARAVIARAEQLAGRPVDRKVLAGGVHSHDGGATWEHH